MKLGKPCSWATLTPIIASNRCRNEGVDVSLFKTPPHTRPRLDATGVKKLKQGTTLGLSFRILGLGGLTARSYALTPPQHVNVFFPNFRHWTWFAAAA